MRSATLKADSGELRRSRCPRKWRSLSMGSMMGSLENVRNGWEADIGRMLAARRFLAVSSRSASGTARSGRRIGGWRMAFTVSPARFHKSSSTWADPRPWSTLGAGSASDSALAGRPAADRPGVAVADAGLARSVLAAEAVSAVAGREG